MITNMRYIDIEPYSDGVDYFLLFLMFAFIIGAVIAVIFFAKWLTLGPKVKHKFNQWFGKDKNAGNTEGVQVKGGEIIIDAGYVDEINAKIKAAKTPQELLEYQLLLEKHNKKADEAKAKIKADEEAKLAKLQEKEELRAAREEAKKEAEILKKQQKEAKEAKKGS